MLTEGKMKREQHFKRTQADEPTMPSFSAGLFFHTPRHRSRLRRSKLDEEEKKIGTAKTATASLDQSPGTAALVVVVGVQEPSLVSIVIDALGAEPLLHHHHRLIRRMDLHPSKRVQQHRGQTRQLANIVRLSHSARCNSGFCSSFVCRSRMSVSCTPRGYRNLVRSHPVEVG